MSWKTRRSTHISVDVGRTPEPLSYGNFVELVRPFLVSLREQWPLYFGDGFYFAFPSSYERADIDDHVNLIDKAIELKGLHNRRGDVSYLDADGNTHDELKPEYFIKPNSIDVHTTAGDGGPKMSIVEWENLQRERPEVFRRAMTRFVFQNFPPDMAEENIDDIIEHVFSWWGNPLAASVGRPSQVFRAAVMNALPPEMKKAKPVLWKAWHVNGAISDEPLPSAISQIEAHGGVWTVIDGAEEAPAESDHPLVQLAAQATRIAHS